MKPVCGTASESVLYGWGKNAPATLMPRGAGFSVGPGTGIRTLVLQVGGGGLGVGNDGCPRRPQLVVRSPAVLPAGAPSPNRSNSCLPAFAPK